LEVLGVNAHIYQEKFEQKLWWHGAGAGHYFLSTRKWMHFIVLNTSLTDDPAEWHPARYFGQDEAAEERLKDSLSYISELAVQGAT
tara:strand:- start:283 stop:540 length:258 start_codon:yes stop_codon:yes gene_type:complete